MASKRYAELEAEVARLRRELQAVHEAHRWNLVVQRKLFEEATEGIVLADADTGEILDCNQAFLELSGYERQELVGRPQKMLHPPEPDDNQVSRTFELHRSTQQGAVLGTQVLTKGGTFRDVEIKANIVETNGRRVMQGFFRDVTAELHYRQERETTLRLLRLLNDRNNTRDLIHSLTGFLQQWTGCTAVGVRLREGDDYPYYETRGFPAEFVAAERQLCARHPDGPLLCDAEGKPVLECLCGGILCGTINLALPCFTAQGSFWTNDVKALLAGLRAADYPLRFRGRCITEGYQSLALIPLRHGGRTLGLLQINDRQTGRFTSDLITFLERTADQIAMTLAARQSEDALRLSEERFRDISEAAGEFIWEVDPLGYVTYISDRVEAVVGFRPDEVLGHHPFEFMTEAEVERIAAQTAHYGDTHSGFRDFETRLVGKTGETVWLSSTGVPVFGPAGELLGFRGATLDVTQRKRAEQALAEEAVRRQILIEESRDGIHVLDENGKLYEANRRFAEMLGYTLAELQQLHVWDWDAHIPHEQLLARIRGIGPAGECFETRHRRKDGSLYDTEVSINVANYAGRRLYFCVGRDISQRKRAERALQEREGIYSAIVNQAANGIVLIDPHTLRFVEFNAAACRGLGYTREEFAQLTLRDIEGSETPERGLHRVQAIVAAGGGTYETLQRTKQGEIRNVRIRSQMVQIRDREFLAGIWTDVTEQKQAEEELRESEAKYRTLFETMSQGVFYQRADGVLLDVNPAALNLFGLTRDEFLRRMPHDPAWNIIREDGSLVDPDGLPSMLALASGKPVRDALVGVFNPQRKTYVWVVINAIPEFRAGESMPYRVFVTMHDITRRRQAEEALRQNALFLRQTQQIARLGGWQANPATDYLQWSEGVYDILEESYDYKPGFADGGRCFLPEYAPAIIEQLTRCLDTGAPFALECRLRTATGKIRWVEVRGLGPVKEGDRSYVVGTLQDITERKQAEETRRELEMQLLHSQKLESLGILAGGIAHDFNNILAGIRAHADLALAVMPHHPATEHLTEIQTATQRAADLTRQILAYAGKAQFRLEPVELSQIVADMRKMLEVVVSKKAHLRYRLAPDLQATLADASQLRQVVMNLVVNASEALGDASGQVTIVTTMVSFDASPPVAGLAAGDYVCLEVSDTGCGMDAATQQKIFEPFFTTKFTGRGLGLATVQGIIRAHQGAIDVHSAPGQGATFRVFLRACGAVPLPAAQAPPSRPGRGTGTVLVVDDEETVRKTTKMLFALAGFEVLTAADGQQAIDVFRTNHDQIVCVVLDLTMPKMGGDEVFAELRRIDPNVRVILTSGYGEQDMMARFAGQRVFGFVEKPAPIDGIIAKLQDALAADASGRNDPG
jgi:two-component system cell cycle sensor histidine kinase/response regulator CckA